MLMSLSFDIVNNRENILIFTVTFFTFFTSHTYFYVY